MIVSIGFGWVTPTSFCVTSSWTDDDADARAIVLGAMFGAALAVHDMTPSGAGVEWVIKPDYKPGRTRAKVVLAPRDESLPAKGPAMRRHREAARRLADRFYDRISTAMRVERNGCW